MIALLAPILVQVAAPAFAPPLDTPLTYRVSEVRDDGSRVQRFAIDRRVTFRRTPNGLVAEVETLAIDGDPGRSGRLFEAMARAMIGRTVVLHLNATGAVTTVDDLDTVWAAQLDGMTTALAGTHPARAASVTALLAPLRAMPRAAQIARVGEMVAPLILSGAASPSPARNITLPGRTADGSPVLLAGTERVTATAPGVVSIERRVSATDAGTTTTQVLRRRVTPATGLIDETVRIDTVETAAARQVITRTTTIRP